MSGLILVIAWGNPLRGDDGVGWQVVEELERRLGRHGGSDGEKVGHDGSGLRTVAVHQLTPELAEEVSRADLVVLVDAARDGPPGSVRCRPIEPAAARRSGPGVFSHDFDPGALLACAGALFGRQPPAYVVSIGGLNFGHAAELSDRVASAVPEAVEAVLGLAGALRHADGPSGGGRADPDGVPAGLGAGAPTASAPGPEHGEQAEAVRPPSQVDGSRQSTVHERFQCPDR